MNITQIATAVGISILIAAGGTAPLTNTSETGITRSSRTETTITRTEHSSKDQGETITLRGEAEYIYVNYESVDLLAFTRLDMDTPSSAQMVVGMMDSPYFTESLEGYVIEGTFEVQNAGECTGLYGYMNMQEVWLVGCADGSYVNLIIGTDEQTVIDAAQLAYSDGVFVVPEGYVKERM